MTWKNADFILLPQRLGVLRIGVGWRFLLVAVVLAAYMTVSRIIFEAGGLSFAEVEVLRTPFRLMGALLFWLLMADVIFGHAPQVRPLRHPLALVGISLVLIAPILTFDFKVSAADAVILALASFPVAFFEELFFRGILQTLLVKSVGAIQGISLTCACFVVFHFGVTSPDTANLMLIFLTGAVLSLIYFKTGSLAAVVLLHAADDVIIGLPLEPILPPEAAVFSLFVSVLLLMRWAKSRD